MRLAITVAAIALAATAHAQPPAFPLQPDAHTLALYHFDEGRGAVAADASGHGYDLQLQGAAWASGRFGGALELGGEHACAFRATTPAVAALTRFTVECWFKQDDPSGRQFLAGKDVGFHFDLGEGTSTSLSVYNLGGGVKNADGLPHAQVATQAGGILPRQWNHLAACYDGRTVTFILNGVLIARRPAPRDFGLGTPETGFWVGCYVGKDYWFSGLIDEMRISDCVRYDPDSRLAEGERVFPSPVEPPPAKAVRAPRRTGEAALAITLKPLYGGDAAGWVYFKTPAARASIVGRYQLDAKSPKTGAVFQYDVSDEMAATASATGPTVVALEPDGPAGYFEMTTAAVRRRDNLATLAWQGHARSRRTFQPPILVALSGASDTGPARPLILAPDAADRLTGAMRVDQTAADAPAVLTGTGGAEWWVHVPARSAYRVCMRYAARSPRPCDFVIDGADLNDYNMCARSSTGGSRARDAMWEFQGATTLSAGLHWVRVEGMPPDIYGIRFEPIAAAPSRKVPLAAYPVPAPDFLSLPTTWNTAPLFGAPLARARTARPEGARPQALQPGDSSPGAGAQPIRSTRTVRADLSHFGRIRFRFVGQGTQRPVALRLVDAKGDEKLLWRGRDTQTGAIDLSVPISFEGNDVFDPAHVAAICLDEEVDSVTSRPAAVAQLVFDRRDDLAARQAAPTGRRPATAAPQPDIAPLAAPAYTPWTKPVVPEAHPLFAATEPKPVTRATMGYNLHFTGARSIDADSLDQFHRIRSFGDVCWPHIGILPQRRDYKTDADYATAMAETETRLRDVRKRGLYLFDIWGYVPFGEAGPVPHVTPEHHAMLTGIFGDRFLGYDNGEQDGRYIGAYADRGSFTDREGGWADIVKWDEGICADSMGYMNATGSLNFSHYYGERGDRTLGLETAQGLPSDTLMFAFLRGASKQYGRLTTQATSVWNRFGYNMYNDRRTEGGNGYGLGPNKGCSLSLHKRLFFSSYTGGDSICGTETSQFTADRLPSGAKELSPLGKQHLAIADWVKQHPDCGVLCTPVAFMLDFHSGWTVPRHLYRGDKYKVWGKLPYEKGDYLADTVFRMVWPGYEDASYLRSERGFVCDTPFGDIFDVITNKCHPAVLKQYAAIMLLGDVEMTPDLVRNLTEWVRAGGDLLTDARRAAALPADLTGITIAPEARAATVSRAPWSPADFAEQPYTYAATQATSAKALLTADARDPLLTVAKAGKGRVIVCAADYWMTDKLTYAHPDLVDMEPPYTLLQGVRTVLSRYFAGFSPVEVTPNALTVRTCRYANDPKRLLVALFNNNLFADWQGRLTVRAGAVRSARDIRNNRALPASRTIPLTIPAGDVAIVDIRLR